MLSHARPSSRRSRGALIEGLETRMLMAAPIAGTGFYAAPPNGVLNVDAPGLFSLASDPDGDPIVSAAIASSPSNGIVQLTPNTGAFTYTPTPGFEGFDSFRYFVSDGTANSNIGMVLLFVGSRGVTASDDVYSVDQGQVLMVDAPGVLGNDVQVDNFALTAIVDSMPANGSLTLDPSGAFTYIPTPNFSGTDSFTYHAFDGGAHSNIATVTITVSPVQPPASNLLDALKALRANGSLNHGQFTSLAKKLELSEDRLDDGKTRQGRKKLEDFIKQVEQLMKGKHPELTAAQGQSLISAAQALLAAI